MMRIFRHLFACIYINLSIFWNELLGNVQSFHFPYNIAEKILQIRRIDVGADKDDSSESDDGFSDTADDDQGEGGWWGEVDISNLGVVYAKLRDPLKVVNIQVKKLFLVVFVLVCHYLLLNFSNNP
jgi:hypothetical protein